MGHLATMKSAGYTGDRGWKVKRKLDEAALWSPLIVVKTCDGSRELTWWIGEGSCVSIMKGDRRYGIR